MYSEEQRQVIQILTSYLAQCLGLLYSTHLLSSRLDSLVLMQLLLSHILSTTFIHHQSLVPGSQQQTQESSGFASAPLLASFITLGSSLSLSESKLSSIEEGKHTGFIGLL